MNKGEHIKGLYIISKNDIHVDMAPVHIGYMVGNVLSDSEKSLLYPEPESGCYLIELASTGTVIIHIVFHLDSFYFLLYLLDIHFLPDKIENLELHLDQEKEGNLWRFLNHSDDPNIKVFSYFDELNGIEVVKVYAIKSVKSGDELCFDYGEKYWNQSDD